MGVFDQSTRVGRLVPDPGTDKRLPPPGALSYGAVTSPSALAGTVGIHCVLVMGDVWQQHVGNHTQNVILNKKVTVYQDLRHTTFQNSYYTYVQNYTELVIGVRNETTIDNHFETNINPRFELRICPVTEQDCSPKTQCEDGGESSTRPWQFSGTGAGLTIFGINAQLNLISIQITGVNFQALAANFELHLIHGEIHIFQIDLSVYEGKFKAAISKFIATWMLVGILQFNIMFKPNALLHPSPITPFE